MSREPLKNIEWETEWETAGWADQVGRKSLAMSWRSLRESNPSLRLKISPRANEIKAHSDGSHRVHGINRLSLESERNLSPATNHPWAPRLTGEPHEDRC